MGKYYAMVSFNTIEFEADSEDEAEGMLQQLIDDLSGADTAIAWDDANWIIYEEGGI